MADIIISNDRAYLKPSRQPPEDVEVKRPYEGLWGCVGPSSPPIPGNRVSELPVNEDFAPVTAEEVEERINKIRKKSAAGPNGLQKQNLMIPGLSEIVAKIFDLLFYGSCYPTCWKENRTTLIPKPNKDISKVT